MTAAESSGELLGAEESIPDHYSPDETVLITGCSSGIGRATAELFAEEGWHVYATARYEENLDDLAALDAVETASLDVTDQSEIDAVVDRMLTESGAVDCLVNNAGYAQFGPLEDVPVEDLHRQFAVNVYGPHRLTRAVLPHMRESESGTIVNVSAGLGRLSVPGTGAFSGSKFALEAMSDALRAEVNEYGVHVVVVEPGPVETSFLARAAAESDRLRHTEAYEWVYSLIEDAAAFGGGGPVAIEPEDVAETIVQAASCRTPATRYPVGTLARGANLARLVPDRVRDVAFGLVRRVVR